MTSCELNASFRLKSFLGFNEKKISVESFVYSDFNYFLLVWHFSNSKFQQKIKIIQNRVLQFFHNDYEASYKDLLDIANKHTIAIQRLRALFLEKCAIKHLLNQTKWNLEVGSQRLLGPNIWNSLPPPIKNAENLFACKQIIKAWNCISFKCNICKYVN